MRRILPALALLIPFFVHAQTPAAKTPPAPAVWSAEALREDIRRLKPLAKPLGPAAAGDWRSSFEERPQNFAQWLACDPVVAGGDRRLIVVQPIGDFTPAQRKILERTAQHLGVFYRLPVQTLPDMSVRDIPSRARRTGPDGSRQLLTTHLLQSKLPPLRTGRTAFLIALTAEDLWPGDGWNFVFGMASLESRVGVWSLHRFGDPAAGEEQRKLCLRRAVKVASHEAGHMFSMGHCLHYRCGMNGANSLPEADSQPLEFCPECLAKLAYATRCDPRQRMEGLRDWYSENGFADEAARCDAALAALRGEAPPADETPEEQPARELPPGTDLVPKPPVRPAPRAR